MPEIGSPSVSDLSNPMALLCYGTLGNDPRQALEGLPDERRIYRLTLPESQRLRNQQLAGKKLILQDCANCCRGRFLEPQADEQRGIDIGCFQYFLLPVLPQEAANRAGTAGQYFGAERLLVRQNRSVFGKPCDSVDQLFRLVLRVGDDLGNRHATLRNNNSAPGLHHTDDLAETRLCLIN
jgi:hypothetical protein